MGRALTLRLVGAHSFGRGVLGCADPHPLITDVYHLAARASASSTHATAASSRSRATTSRRRTSGVWRLHLCLPRGAAATPRRSPRDSLDSLAPIARLAVRRFASAATRRAQLGFSHRCDAALSRGGGWGCRLSYWLVYSTFGVVIAPVNFLFQELIPFWFYMKIAFLVWCMLPSTKVTENPRTRRTSSLQRRVASSRVGRSVGGGVRGRRATPSGPARETGRRPRSPAVCGFCSALCVATHADDSDDVLFVWRRRRR